MAASDSFKALWILTLLLGVSSQIDDIVVDTPDDGCPRHRKPWHLISQSERDLYINGMLELAQQGKLAVFTNQHAVSGANNQAHRSSSFLPWHRYYLWELESQIRDLGDEYECFALPYWDWTWDRQQHGTDFQNYQILNSGLGGTGNPGNNYCVEDGSFTTDNYIPSSCSGEANCCLKRNTCQDAANWCNIQLFTDAIYNMVDSKGEYGGDAGNESPAKFRANLQRPHGSAHVTFGGAGIGQLANPAISPDDPIFYLLHAFVDYQWALWQDCYNYDLTLDFAITDDMYKGEQTGISGLDDALKFGELSATDWAYYRPGGWVKRGALSESNVFWNGEALSNRDMHSIALWGVSYEQGSFVASAAQELGDVWNNCPLNQNWFKSTLRVPDPDGFSPSFATITFDQILTGITQNGSLSVADLHFSDSRLRAAVNSWSQINCEMSQAADGNVPCKRPKCFDDCSDLVPACNENQSGQPTDIEITLEELVERVKDYPCMVATRKNMFEWAKANGNLLGLCRGDFDNFCDGNDVIQQRNVDVCPVTAEVSVDEQDVEGDQDERNERERKRRSRGSAHQSMFDIDDGIIDNKYLGDMDKRWMVFGGVVVMSIVIVNVIVCFYLDRKWRRESKKDGVKYHDVDQDEI